MCFLDLPHPIQLDWVTTTAASANILLQRTMTQILLKLCAHPQACCGFTPSNTRFCRNPSKSWPQAWQRAKSTDRDLHHSEITPALGRGKDNETYQLDCDPCSGLGEETWSDCKPRQPMKPLRGQYREITLQFGATLSLPNVWSDSTQGQGGLS